MLPETKTLSTTLQQQDKQRTPGGPDALHIGQAIEWTNVWKERRASLGLVSLLPLWLL